MYTTLYRLEDIAFATRSDLKKFQDEFIYGKKRSVRKLEYRWAEMYFEPLTEFMGDRTLWEALGIPVTMTDTTTCELGDVAYFSGSHWTSRKAGTKEEVFDPYDEYQVPGTHQFCQTFCMMHLRNRLPAKITQNGRAWLKYYAYTMEALEFIDELIRMCKRDPKLSTLPTFRERNTTFDILERAIRVCKSHPYMCLNIVKMP